MDKSIIILATIAASLILIIVIVSVAAFIHREIDQKDIYIIKSDILDYCDSLCDKAFETEDGAIEYCLSAYTKGVDIDQDGRSDGATDQLDYEHIICEDHIPCPIIKPCGDLNMKRCVELLCDGANEQASSDRDAAKIVFGYNEGKYRGQIIPGDCLYGLDDDQLIKHWFIGQISYRDILSLEREYCYIKAGTCLPRKEFVEEEYGDTWDEDCEPLYY